LRHVTTAPCGVFPLSFGWQPELRHRKFAYALAVVVQVGCPPFSKEYRSVPVNADNGIVIVTGVPVIVVLNGISHVVCKILNPNGGIRIVFHAKSFGIDGLKSFNCPGIDQEKVRELPILVIGDFGVVHEEGADSHLLIEVDLCRGWVFICLPHMESTSGYWNHSVWYSHNPSFPAGHANQFALVAASATSQANQTAN